MKSIKEDFIDILESQRIKPVFQPIVSLLDGTIIGYEALSRVTEPIRHYKSQGYTIAVDDAGSCYSGLNLICDIAPHYLKLDLSPLCPPPPHNFYIKITLPCL